LALIQIGNKVNDMIRDSIKDKQYFENYLSKQSERADNFRSKLNSNEVKDDRLAAVRRKLFDLEFYSLIASYSSGESISVLKDTLSNVISTYNLSVIETIKSTKEINFILDTYVDYLWLVSITYLIGEENDLQKLAATYELYEEHDYLLDTLLGSVRINREISQELLFIDEYEEFKSILISPQNQATDKLKMWVNKTWFKLMETTSWHGEHNHKNNVYFGYWCFESAAFIKLLGLQKEEFKECKFFPYDLL